jgi:hypothetical protein
VRRIEHEAAAGDGIAAHVDAHDRLVGDAREMGDGARRALRLRDGLGRQQHDDAVDVRVADDDLDRGLVAVGGGIAEHVDRVGRRRGGRERARQHVAGDGRELRQLQPKALDGVRGHDPGAARVRDDGDALALRGRQV